MLLDISNLCIEYLHTEARKSICQNITFSIGDGDTLGILGESGSGKSITALSILRLLPPSITISRGDINYTRTDGGMENLVNSSAKTLQQIRGKEISMIFQEPMTSLNPVFSCGDQVSETILHHQDQPNSPGIRHPWIKNSSREVKEQVLSLFHKVNLKDPLRVYDSYPYQLSGGQKQRVMIAMAISCNPRLLIADEPTTALDVTVQRSVLTLIRDLQREMGMSVLFITHDINVLEQMAQRILILKSGEIVEQGEISEVLSNPKHYYTKGLLACRASLTDKSHRLITLEDFLHPSLSVQPMTRPIHANNQKVPLLTIQELNLSFQQNPVFPWISNKNQILHNITLDVFKNETLGLVGESGSGKTTLGRSIMRLIAIDSGLIRFHGTAIQTLWGKDLKKFRKRVQIIFQDPYAVLNPKHTIGEMITEPMLVHRLYRNSNDRKKRTLELLRQVQLDESYYSRYPHQFSGGQRQRIGIARALAVEPELLILDESVSALDVSIQAQILNLLNELKESFQLTYLFISHDLQTVRYMSDRMVVLKEGRIVEAGTTEDIFNTPKDPYTRELLGYQPK